MPAPRILIAEDDPVVGSLLASMLSIDGYEVQIVTDGDQALEAVDTFDPDLAILDIMMPLQDGMSVLRSLRVRAETKTMPVILLTAKSDRDTTWEGWRAGCDSYIAKPFDPEVLTTTIERLLPALGRSR